MCKFCEAMEINWKADAILQRDEPAFEYRYSVAIVRRVFKKEVNGCRGSSTDYRSRGCGYDLNYCPECGRKLTKNSAIDDLAKKE